MEPLTVYYFTHAFWLNHMEAPLDYCIVVTDLVFTGFVAARISIEPSKRSWYMICEATVIMSVCESRSPFLIISHDYQSMLTGVRNPSNPPDFMFGSITLVINFVDIQSGSIAFAQKIQNSGEHWNCRHWKSTHKNTNPNICFFFKLHFRRLSNGYTCLFSDAFFLYPSLKRQIIMSLIRRLQLISVALPTAWRLIFF